MQQVLEDLTCHGRELGGGDFESCMVVDRRDGEVDAVLESCSAVDSYTCIRIAGRKYTEDCGFDIAGWKCAEERGFDIAGRKCAEDCEYGGESHLHFGTEVRKVGFL